MDLTATTATTGNYKRKRTELILEARHSKSIEAAKKLRSKLKSRLFIPRTPIQIYKYTALKQNKPPKFFANTTFNTKDSQTEEQKIAKYIAEVPKTSTKDQEISQNLKTSECHLNSNHELKIRNELSAKKKLRNCLKGKLEIRNNIHSKKLNLTRKGLQQIYQLNFGQFNCNRRKIENRIENREYLKPIVKQQNSKDYSKKLALDQNQTEIELNSEIQNYSKPLIPPEIGDNQRYSKSYLKSLSLNRNHTEIQEISRTQSCSKPVIVHQNSENFLKSLGLDQTRISNPPIEQEKGNKQQNTKDNFKNISLQQNQPQIQEISEAQIYLSSEIELEKCCDHQNSENHLNRYSRTKDNSSPVIEQKMSENQQNTKDNLKNLSSHQNQTEIQEMSETQSYSQSQIVSEKCCNQPNSENYLKISDSKHAIELKTSNNQQSIEENLQIFNLHQNQTIIVEISGTHHNNLQITVEPENNSNHKKEDNLTSRNLDWPINMSAHKESKMNENVSVENGEKSYDDIIDEQIEETLRKMGLEIEIETIDLTAQPENIKNSENNTKEIPLNKKNYSETEENCIDLTIQPEDFTNSETQETGEMMEILETAKNCIDLTNQPDNFSNSETQETVEISETAEISETVETSETLASPETMENCIDLTNQPDNCSKVLDIVVVNNEIHINTINHNPSEKPISSIQDQPDTLQTLTETSENIIECNRQRLKRWKGLKQYVNKKKIKNDTKTLPERTGENPGNSTNNKNDKEKLKSSQKSVPENSLESSRVFANNSNDHLRIIEVITTPANSLPEESPENPNKIMKISQVFSNISKENLATITKEIIETPQNRPAKKSLENSPKTRKISQNSLQTNNLNSTQTINSSPKKKYLKSIQQQQNLQSDQICDNEILTNYNNSISPCHQEFRNIVEQTISELDLYCSSTPVDLEINTNLNDLVNSIKDFEEFLLQTCKDMEAKEQEANETVQYFSNLEEYRFLSQFQQSSYVSINEESLGLMRFSEEEEPNNPNCTSSLENTANPLPLPDEFVIQINAPEIPVQTITFKTSEILDTQNSLYETNLGFENAPENDRAMNETSKDTENQSANKNSETSSPDQDLNGDGNNDTYRFFSNTIDFNDLVQNQSIETIIPTMPDDQISQNFVSDQQHNKDKRKRHQSKKDPSSMDDRPTSSNQQISSNHPTTVENSSNAEGHYSRKSRKLKESQNPYDSHHRKSSQNCNKRTYSVELNDEPSTSESGKPAHGAESDEKRKQIKLKIKSALKSRKKHAKQDQKRSSKNFFNTAQSEANQISDHHIEQENGSENQTNCRENEQTPSYRNESPQTSKQQLQPSNPSNAECDKFNQNISKNSNKNFVELKKNHSEQSHLVNFENSTSNQINSTIFNNNQFASSDNQNSTNSNNSKTAGLDPRSREAITSPAQKVPSFTIGSLLSSPQIINSYPIQNPVSSPAETEANNQRLVYLNEPEHSSNNAVTSQVQNHNPKTRPVEEQTNPHAENLLQQQTHQTPTNDSTFSQANADYRLEQNPGQGAAQKRQHQRSNLLPQQVHHVERSSQHSSHYQTQKNPTNDSIHPQINVSNSPQLEAPNSRIIADVGRTLQSQMQYYRSSFQHSSEHSFQQQNPNNFSFPLANPAYRQEHNAQLRSALEGQHAAYNLIHPQGYYSNSPLLEAPNPGSIADGGRTSQSQLQDHRSSIQHSSEHSLQQRTQQNPSNNSTFSQSNTGYRQEHISQRRSEENYQNSVTSPPSNPIHNSNSINRTAPAVIRPKLQEKNASSSKVQDHSIQPQTSNSAKRKPHTQPNSDNGTQNSSQDHRHLNNLVHTNNPVHRSPASPYNAQVRSTVITKHSHKQSHPVNATQLSPQGHGLGSTEQANSRKSYTQSPNPNLRSQLDHRHQQSKSTHSQTCPVHQAQAQKLRDNANLERTLHQSVISTGPDVTDLPNASSQFRNNTLPPLLEHQHLSPTTQHISHPHSSQSQYPPPSFAQNQNPTFLPSIEHQHSSQTQPLPQSQHSPHSLGQNPTFSPSLEQQHSAQPQNPQHSLIPDHNPSFRATFEHHHHHPNIPNSAHPSNNLVPYFNPAMRPPFGHAHLVQSSYQYLPRDPNMIARPLLDPQNPAFNMNIPGFPLTPPADGKMFYPPANLPPHHPAMAPPLQPSQAAYGYRPAKPHVYNPPMHTELPIPNNSCWNSRQLPFSEF